MKRCRALILALFLLLTPLRPSLAESRAAFTADVVTAVYGETVTVSAQLFSDREVTWTLQTDQGRVLCTQTLQGDGREIPFSFPAAEDLPRRTVLQLKSSDGDQVLCEALLFCDQYQNGGIRRVARSDRKMAITFDAAVSPASIWELLDLLDKYEVKCTFFVIGMFVERNPKEAAEIVARGHELASHSYEHLEMGDASAREAYRSLQRAESLIQSVNNGQRVLYRPPSGVSTFRDRAIARGMGSEVIIWSVDSGDGFASRGPLDVLYQVYRSLHNGGIVLMHIYGGHTLKVLAEILPKYQAQGFSFVTVSDLLLDEADSYIDAYGSQRPLHHGGDLFTEAFYKALRTDGAADAGAKKQFVQGRGTMSVSGSDTGDGLCRARVRYDGSGSFMAWTFDAQDRGDLLVSTFGGYRGQALLLGQGPRAFEVEASGDWTIELEPVGVTDAAAFAGRGDCVTDMASLPAGQYRLTHDGNSDFLVWAYTTTGEQLLVHRLGAAEEVVQVEVPSDSRVFFAIRADGNWTIAPVA